MLKIVTTSWNNIIIETLGRQQESALSSLKFGFSEAYTILYSHGTRPKKNPWI